MIVVLHRERSEKLARRFVDAMREQTEVYLAWSELESDAREWVVGAFDSLIQDGLIGEREPGQ